MVEISVFELVGGQPFFDDLVDAFYERVERDPVLRPIYPEDLAPGKRALAMFLAQYWGGPPEYSAEKGHPRLRMRHARSPSGPSNATRGSRRCSPRSTTRTRPKRPKQPCGSTSRWQRPR